MPTPPPIETAIPIPASRGRPALYKLDDLGYGHSRLFVGDHTRIRKAVSKQAGRLGIKVTSRKEGDGLRVWRVRP